MDTIVQKRITLAQLKRFVAIKGNKLSRRRLNVLLLLHRNNGSKLLTQQQTNYVLPAPLRAGSISSFQDYDSQEISDTYTVRSDSDDDSDDSEEKSTDDSKEKQNTDDNIVQYNNENEKDLEEIIMFDSKNNDVVTEKKNNDLNITTCLEEFCPDSQQWKQCYRKNARKYHPDKSKLPNAVETFQRLNECNNIITNTNDDNSQNYDQKLEVLDEQTYELAKLNEQKTNESSVDFDKQQTNNFEFNFDDPSDEQNEPAEFDFDEQNEPAEFDFDEQKTSEPSDEQKEPVGFDDDEQKTNDSSDEQTEPAEFNFDEQKTSEPSNEQKKPAGFDIDEQMINEPSNKKIFNRQNISASSEELSEPGVYDNDEKHKVTDDKKNTSAAQNLVAAETAAKRLLLRQLIRPETQATGVLLAHLNQLYRLFGTNDNDDVAERLAHAETEDFFRYFAQHARWRAARVCAEHSDSRSLKQLAKSIFSALKEVHRLHQMLFEDLYSAPLPTGHNNPPARLKPLTNALWAQLTASTNNASAFSSTPPPNTDLGYLVRQSHPGHALLPLYRLDNSLQLVKDLQRRAKEANRGKLKQTDPGYLLKINQRIDEIDPAPTFECDLEQLKHYMVRIEPAAAPGQELVFDNIPHGCLVLRADGSTKAPVQDLEAGDTVQIQQDNKRQTNDIGTVIYVTCVGIRAKRLAHQEIALKVFQETDPQTTRMFVNGVPGSGKTRMVVDALSVWFKNDTRKRPTAMFFQDLRSVEGTLKEMCKYDNPYLRHVLDIIRTHKLFDRARDAKTGFVRPEYAFRGADEDKFEQSRFFGLFCMIVQQSNPLHTLAKTHDGRWPFEYTASKAPAYKKYKLGRKLYDEWVAKKLAVAPVRCFGYSKDFENSAHTLKIPFAKFLRKNSGGKVQKVLFDKHTNPKKPFDKTVLVFDEVHMQFDSKKNTTGYHAAAKLIREGLLEEIRDHTPQSAVLMLTGTPPWDNLLFKQMLCGSKSVRTLPSRVFVFNPKQLPFPMYPRTSPGNPNNELDVCLVNTGWHGATKNDAKASERYLAAVALNLMRPPPAKNVSASAPQTSNRLLGSKDLVLRANGHFLLRVTKPPPQTPPLLPATENGIPKTVVFFEQRDFDRGLPMRLRRILLTNMADSLTSDHALVEIMTTGANAEASKDRFLRQAGTRFLLAHESNATGTNMPGAMRICFYRPPRQWSLVVQGFKRGSRACQAINGRTEQRPVQLSMFCEVAPGRRDTEGLLALEQLLQNRAKDLQQDLETSQKTTGGRGGVGQKAIANAIAHGTDVFAGATDDGQIVRWTTDLIEYAAPLPTGDRPVLHTSKYHRAGARPPPPPTGGVGSRAGLAALTAELDRVTGKTAFKTAAREVLCGIANSLGIVLPHDATKHDHDLVRKKLNRALQAKGVGSCQSPKQAPKKILVHKLDQTLRNIPLADRGLSFHELKNRLDRHEHVPVVVARSVHGQNGPGEGWSGKLVGYARVPDGKGAHTYFAALQRSNESNVCAYAPFESLMINPMMANLSDPIS